MTLIKENTLYLRMFLKGDDEVIVQHDYGVFWDQQFSNLNATGVNRWRLVKNSRLTCILGWIMDGIEQTCSKPGNFR